jgi:hypothetical protein
MPKETHAVGQPERRLRLTDVRVGSQGGRCTVDVTLERQHGRAIVSRMSDEDSERGVAHAAAYAAAAALGEAIGAGPDAFEILEVKKIGVFDMPGIIVAIAIRGGAQPLKVVGFGLLEGDKAALAAVIAVLHGTNRYVSQFLTKHGTRD